MNYLTQKLLNNEELELLKINLNKKDVLWEDGKKTAGSKAARTKTARTKNC